MKSSFKTKNILSIFKKYLLFFKDKNILLIFKDILTLTLALGLSWIIYDYGSLSLQKRQDSIEDNTVEFDLNNKDYDISTEDFKKELSSNFELIKSVTSILKTYYVDNSKLTNTSLILYTLDNLANIYSDIDVFYSFNENSNFETLDLSYVNNNVDTISSSNSLLFTNTVFLKIVTPFKSLKLTVHPNLDDITLNSHLLKTTFLIKDYLFKNKESYSNPSSIVLNSLLQSLDPHSNLLTKEDYNDLRMNTEGHFGGVGLIVNIQDYLLTVVDVIPETPAAKSNKIFIDDKIIKINDTFTFGVSLEELIEIMRGKIGENVRLSILSSKTNSIEVVTLTREDIEKQSVSTTKLNNTPYNIAYSKIEVFSKNTSDEILQQLDDFKKTYGNIQGLILDLRSNPGGLLDQAVKISDMFLTSGTIVTTKGQWEEVSNVTTIKENSRKRLFSKKTTKDFYHTSYPMIVLVNKESASASEIVAAALQDNSRALIIGQPTFGKGSVQSLMQLNNEENPAFKLTVSRYFTPKGRSIQNIGIIPDIWLQPIFKKENNQNILGSNRLNNENFSKNRLNSSSLNEYLNNINISPLKGYYLTDEKNYNKILSSSINNQDISSDYDIDISSRILNKVLSTYNGISLKSMFRPYHWLGLAKEVNTLIKNKDTEAKSWIKSSFNIKWDSDTNTFESDVYTDDNINHNGNISLSLSNKKLESYTGNTLNIPVLIKNNTNKNLDKLSLFILSSDESIESNEILISDINAYEERKENLSFYIPNYISSKHIPIYIGLTQDSSVISSTLISNNIKVVSSDKASINYKIINKGIQNSELIFDLQITNTSNINIKQLNTTLVNLNGNLISIDKDSYKNQLHKHNNITIPIRIKVNNTSYNPINIGLYISSDDIKVDIMKLIQIQSNVDRTTSEKYTYTVDVF